MKYKLGIDVGGTFTDFFLVGDDGSALIHKTLSTPEDSSIGFITGTREIAEKLNLELSTFINEINTIVHGTTVATNAILTMNGAKTALITTKGFRDALEMRRGIREERYNNHYKNVKPLVPRYLRYTINERTDASGKSLIPVKTSELDEIIVNIKKEDVKAIAICFMNSYLNSEHEKFATEYLRATLPDLFISASFEVLPSVRFYERVSTTCINAYIGVVIDKYLESLLGKLHEINFKGKLMIMQSNGGIVTPEVARKIAAVTVLSGPAAAPIAGAYYAELLGYNNCITMDMGGTSFDTSLVVNRKCVTSTDGEIDRHRIALPTLDIITIGAGGGSIGWIDKGGLLQMGPKSAGALPGPISYDCGGTEPACTDADLILGYLDPNFFAGGKYILNKEKTVSLTRKTLGEPLGMDVVKTAAGMYRVINMNMAQGVRQVSVERGYDPREFLLLCAGGAGPIHAGEICRELEIPMFVVPDVASIFCAAGMLLGDLKHDYVRSYMTWFSKIEKNKFLSFYDDMKTEAIATLTEEGISKEKIEYYPSLDIRYVGQFHEVPLEVTMNDITNFNTDSIAEAFHKEHNRKFGYELKQEGTELEIINVRLRAVGVTEKPLSLSGNKEAGAETLEQALKGRRQAYVPEVDKMQEIPVYNGDILINNFKIEGPALIEQINTTIFIGASYNCETGIGGTFIVYNKFLMPNGFEKKLQTLKINK
ncbi:MAG: 5-oxoprolinase [Bacteroidetes bacterium CG23_combo_of_CG06-09_8_20_14_all_32_9]|nr:MAG: 5-oxoprolinase [Bacteroidetes bacterium CG23_combo_of_CG06-09_8_20_14_all_32_9]